MAILTNAAKCVPPLARVPILGSSTGSVFLLASRNLNPGGPCAYINLIPGHPQLTIVFWGEKFDLLLEFYRGLSKATVYVDLRTPRMFAVYMHGKEIAGLYTIEELLKGDEAEKFFRMAEAIHSKLNKKRSKQEKVPGT